MKHRSLIIIMIILLNIGLCLSTAGAFNNYLPGFEGRVLDRISRKPINNAYIICFTDYQPFFAHSHYPDSFVISITDQNGHFKIKPYIKLSLGSIDYRKIFIFSEDYLYPLRYFQLPERKMFIRVSPTNYEISDEYNIYSNLELLLYNKQYINKYYTQGLVADAWVADYGELLAEVMYRFNDFDSKRIREFEKYLLFVLTKKSKDITDTIRDPKLKLEWHRKLKEYKDKIEDNYLKLR